MNKDSRLSRRDITKTGIAVTGAAIAAGTIGSRVFAQDATPVVEGPGLPPLPEGATIVAQGLWNPRNLAWGDDGTLYITENGIGGDEVLTGPPPGGEEATPVVEGEAVATPVEATPPSTRGYTGQISAVAPDGTQSVVISGLASYSDGVGPIGIAALDGDLVFTIGGAAVGAGMPSQLPEENTVNRLVLATTTVEQIADIGAYEAENNPDGTDVNPNLYDVVALSDGTLVFNDAGGNVTYTLDPATGEFAELAVYPLQGELPGASADPAGLERQVVPTGLAVDDEDTVYVNFLSEFWPADAPSIVWLDETGVPESVATGLSVIVDIAIGPDGFVYASSLTSDLETFGPGGVFRIGDDGTAEEVVSGLFMPHGITFDAEGNLYVAVYALVSGPGFPGGQVARFDGIAVPA